MTTAIQRRPAKDSSPDAMEIFGACIVEHGDNVVIYPNTGTTGYQLDRMRQFFTERVVTDA